MRRKIRKAGKRRKNECQSETSYGIPTTFTSSSLYVGNMNPCNILISVTTRLTKLPQLPVLFSISPPELQRKAASDAVLEKRIWNRIWNGQSTMTSGTILLQRCNPANQLSDMIPINVTNEWRYDWQTASVVNQTLVSETNLWPHSFDLSYQLWSTLKRFRTWPECCLFAQKWRITSSHKCWCCSLWQRLCSHVRWPHLLMVAF